MRKMQNFESGDLCYAILRFALKSPGFGKEQGYKIENKQANGNQECSN